jgi:hypothetical protein
MNGFKKPRSHDYCLVWRNILSSKQDKIISSIYPAGIKKGSTDLISTWIKK